MTPIILTPHQVEAVQFLADHLHDGDPIVALRGLAGTGKTSLIPALIDVLESTGIQTTLGAPTHRAAMILKKKGLEQADTVHAHALTPYFTGAYTKALRWLGGSCQCRIEDLANAPSPVDGVPWLIAERIKITGHTPEVVKTRARQHEPKKALESIGITGRQHFAGFGAKEGSGVLIIDEASMVGAKMLALCQEAFPQICLVGDPGQLPPVQDKAMLAEVPGFELTEVHRQAKDSRIVQLAYAARYGEKFWESIPYVAGEVEEYTAVEAAAFLESPLVVWRNKTRIECTAAIRASLGFPADVLQVGEPLVCRSTDPRARSEGFYNNSLWRVVPPSILAQQQGDPRFVTVQPDLPGRDCNQPDGNPDADTLDVFCHMEELHGDNVDPEAILFRFGYCLTAHTAQGGEWPVVYISKPDLFAHSKRSPQEGEEDDFARWAYTAITRAKVTLGFLRKHDFTFQSLAGQPWSALAVSPSSLPSEGDTMPKMQQQPKIAPPSAPMLNQDPHEPDDIPDPVLPGEVLGILAQADSQARDLPGLVLPAEPGERSARVPFDNSPTMPAEAPRMPQDASNGTALPSVPSTVPPLPESFLPLAHGFCQYLQGAFGAKLEETAIGMTKEVSATIDGMTRYAQGVLQSNEHVGYQMSDALLKLQEHGLTVHGSPYEMTLQVYTPAGIPLTLTIRKTSAADLLDELTRLETWLALNAYTGEKPAEVGC